MKRSMTLLCANISLKPYLFLVLHILYISMKKMLSWCFGTNGWHPGESFLIRERRKKSESSVAVLVKTSQIGGRKGNNLKKYDSAGWARFTDMKWEQSLFGFHYKTL